jgi:hypothetical protein
MFKGKKILFFSANFFGYQNEIKNSLVKLGADVDYYDERPKNTFWTKAFIRLDKRIVKKKIENYYSNIINKCIEQNYDYVFFLKAEGINFKMLNELKRAQSQAKFILFMWDSIKNSSKDIVEFFPLFDKILSFDRKDVEKHKNLIFRPLFFLDDYKEIAKEKNDIKFDITFIGTGHTDRYALVSKIKQVCAENGLNGYFFVYLQDIKIFIIRKLFKKSYKNAKKNDFSFKPLKKEEIIETIKKSNCILDIQRVVQSGLTMRTLEVLGAEKKLITTNEDIINYDFYNENNILVINRENPKIPLSFIKGKYQIIDLNIYHKYHIDSWLEEVFS